MRGKTLLLAGIIVMIAALMMTSVTDAAQGRANSNGKAKRPIATATFTATPKPPTATPIPPTATPVPPTATPSATPVLTEWADTAAAQAVVAKINEMRAARGLAALREDANVNALAMYKARDMAVRNYFTHTDPDGKNIWNYASVYGVSWSGMGENIGKWSGSAPTTTQVRSNMVTMTANMTSGHLDNILNTGWVKVGVGVYVKGGNILLCQVFVK